MNIFNRIVMIILMLCLVVFLIVAIVNIFANLFEWSAVSERIINYINTINPYILAAILFLILAISLTILVFEFYRKRIKYANISTDSSGNTTVTLKTASLLIRESLNNIQDIINPQVKVVPKQNGIVINIFSKLFKGINVTDKIKEIRDNAKDFASKNLGFNVLQTNYTVTEFITKKVKKVKVIKEEAPEESMQEEQIEDKIES